MCQTIVLLPDALLARARPGVSGRHARPSNRIARHAALLAALAAGSPTLAAAQSRGGQDAAAPLSIGETFTIESRVLAETRRINVYVPAAYAASADARIPVLYMPDGGIQEDFLHVAGLVQVLTGNGGMRPFLLVGIENTARRRDLTGPTENAEDRTIAPVVSGSAAFRRFIRSELKPIINARYRTTGESAIVGESLAGLFVVETFFLEPDLFDTYIAFDPSLWWNNRELVERAAERLPAVAGRSIYLASSGERELAELTKRLADVVAARAPSSLRWHYQPMADESHATIYHPAALRAFRHLFKPTAKQP
jgi:predicted alpha/beta superfamily hydrolase